MTLAEVALALAMEAAHADSVDVEPSDVVAAMRGELIPAMQTAWDDTSPKQFWCTGKRYGKSEYLARRLVRGALEAPRSTNPYVTPTAKQARLLMWPIIKRIVERHVPESKVLDHEMTVHVRLAGKQYGTIVVGGCECRADIGRWFGIPFREAAIDECGTFPPYLSELVTDGLEPSTMDFEGYLTLAGNPGVAPIGYWYECTGPKRVSNVPLYTGDARDNPHVRAAEFFARKLVENGWAEDHPTFQRMYLGNWAWDPSALCFPFSHARNGISALPDVSLAGGRLDPTRWRWVISADVAGPRVTAIVLLAAHPGDPRTFVWSSENHTAWLPEQLEQRVRAIKADRSHGYDMSHAAFIVDAGGLGGGHTLHLTRKAGDLFFEHAQKTDKKSWIREVHDEILAGRMVWLAGERNRAAFDEMAVLEWDEKHEKWIDGPPDHVMDATGYGKRRIAQYARDAVRPVERDPLKLALREAERMKAARLREVNGAQRHGQPRWDRWR